MLRVSLMKAAYSYDCGLNYTSGVNSKERDKGRKQAGRAY